MRDFEQKPYTEEEQRVAKYLVEITGMGGGDDPIDFLIASHAALMRTLEEMQTKRNIVQ